MLPKTRRQGESQVRGCRKLASSAVVPVTLRHDATLRHGAATMPKNAAEERWIPATDAARLLGIAERTLRLRAERGQIERRRSGRHTLYRVPTLPEIETAGLPAATGTGADAALDAIGSHVIAAFNRAIGAAIDRAVAAELRAARAEALLSADTATAEFEQVRAELDAERRRADLAEATARDLGDALRKRAEVVRDLARRVGELERSRGSS